MSVMDSYNLQEQFKENRSSKVCSNIKAFFMYVFACSCRISNGGENRTINLMNQNMTFGRFVKANVALMLTLFEIVH